jgi:8-oxo-dGTP pyrophosphatase MutT (NUDIX family)
MSLRPDLTVAAVLERNGEFLLVEERVGNRMVINQPAGHVERGEQLLAAIIRETLEETAWSFVPHALVGIYLWDHLDRQRSYLRFAFTGELTTHDPLRTLDRPVERTLWMGPEQIRAQSTQLRSPMVLSCIDDYLAGQRYPLDLIRCITSDDATTFLTERRPPLQLLTPDRMSKF